MVRRRFPLIAPLALLAVAGCGGGAVVETPARMPDDAAHKAVVETAEKYVTYVRDGDYERVCKDLMSASLMKAFAGDTKRCADTLVEPNAGRVSKDEPMKIKSVVIIGGATAKVDAPDANGKAGGLYLVREGGNWKVSTPNAERMG